MGNYFEILEEAASEGHQINQAGKPWDVVRLNAILEACEEGCRKGFKLNPGGTPEKIPLADGSDEALSVHIRKFPETTVGGIVAVEEHADGSESGRLLALGTYSNDHELQKIYGRGLKRLDAWVQEHGTLAKTGKTL